MEYTNADFWLLIVGFVIAFILAFGIGANDVANTFGTSVGSKVLTLKQACILATIFETLGSILIGAKVSGTIRQGIVDPALFKGDELELMLGYISALSGCCIWLILATALGLPVSGTHSIVGSTIGMAVVSKGFKVVKWLVMVKIVASWFISPLLSGIVSVGMFFLIRKFILRAGSPLKAGLAFLPVIYTVTIFINLGGILESAPPLLKLDLVPWWGKLIIILGVSVIVYVTVLFLLVPYMSKKILPQTEVKYDADNSNTEKHEISIVGKLNLGFEGDNKLEKSDKPIVQNGTEFVVALQSQEESYIDSDGLDKFAHSDPPETLKLFSFLQILTAVFGSFAHGGNDVSNAIGPLIGLYLVYKEGQVVTESATPEWILFYGGVGISVGLCVLGRRVIKTIGEDLTKITPSSGFVIELASAICVLGASLLNIPVSSTHCKVGSVVFTGRVRSKESVDWSLFRNIAIAWIVTVPITAALSALCQVLLKLGFGLPL